MMNSKTETEETSEEPLTEDKFRTTYQYQPKEEATLQERVKECVDCSPSTISNILPFLKWLPKYQIRRDIIGDLIAGLTVSVMHIPHGLAYAPLAGQPPVVGLYMAVFPTIIYIFLGTSRHLSFGTFAVVCMMVGKTVSEYAGQPPSLSGNVTENFGNGTVTYTNLEAGVTICFLVGLIQFVMGGLHLGSLWLLLSSSLVSGFTAGSALLVMTYQFKNLLGVSTSRVSGPFKWIRTLIDLINHVPETHFVTLGLSCCAIFVLSIFNEILKPRIQKRFPNFKVPVPIELIVILIGIAVSYFLDLESNYGVEIVKSVPVGLPAPVVPVFGLMPKILVDCFVIAVVAISMNLSLAAIFAKKGGYEIVQNQELVAYGASNMFAALFQCVPCSASLSRSLVQSSVGGRTQIAGVFTMITIIFILLFLGPLFEPVPYSVLSSIVVVTLKGLLWQIKDVPGIWRESKMDGLVWIVTFLSVVLVDLDVGLGVGLGMSVLSLILKGQNVNIVQLARIPNTQIFVEANLYAKSERIPYVLILKVSGILHFANISSVHEKLLRMFGEFEESYMVRGEGDELFVILDMSCVAGVDPTAVNGLSGLYKDLKQRNCKLHLSACLIHIYNTLRHCKLFDVFPPENVFISTPKAVDYLIKKDI